MPHVKVACQCGYSIGSIYKAFMILKAKKNAEYMIDTDSTLPTNSIITGEMPELGEILDKLGVYNICCRTNLITQVTALQYLPP